MRRKEKYTNWTKENQTNAGEDTCGALLTTNARSQEHTIQSVAIECAAVCRDDQTDIDLKRGRPSFVCMDASKSTRLQ